MKNVTLSDIVRDRGPGRLPAWPQLARFAVTLALGLPVIALLFHLLDPGAPLAWVIGPVLAGGLLPACALLPGRFDVRTRFHARHLVGTLDATLAQLGYERSSQDGASIRYTPRSRAWLGGRDVAVTLHSHMAEIAGPVSTLRALQRQMRF